MSFHVLKDLDAFANSFSMFILTFSAIYFSMSASPALFFQDGTYHRFHFKFTYGPFVVPLCIGKVFYCLETVVSLRIVISLGKVCILYTY